MSKYKSIISPDKEPLSYEEITAYVNGNLTKEERYTIEQKMMASNLNRDALEGFVNHPEAFKAYEKASDQFHAELPVKKGGLKFQHGVIGIVLFGIIFYTIGAYFLIERDKNIIEQKKAALMSYVNDTIDDHINSTLILPEIIVEELNDQEIDSSIQLASDDQIDAKKVIAFSPIVIDTIANDTTVEEQIEKIITIKKQHPVDPHPFDSLVKKKIVYSNIPTRYSQGLLIVDYPKIGESYIQVYENKLNPILSGTPSNLENFDDSLNEAQKEELNTQKIDYLTYVSETQLLFKQSKYKKALKRYKIIMEQYPNDLNAHFYAGLCYFNINKPNKAIEHFDLVIKHNYNTFNEEAEWYKAKSLAASGKTQELISLLNIIASRNGFYSAKANKWLEEL